MSSVKRATGLDPWLYSPLYGRVGDTPNNPTSNREQYISQMLARNIAELAMNRFEWKGLPKEIDERFLEMTLLTNGLVLWYMEKAFDKLVCAQAAPSGYTNFMNQHVAFNVIGPGTQTQDPQSGIAFMSKTIGAYLPTSHADKDIEWKRTRGIPMWSNRMRIPELDVINIYSTRIAEIERTLEINSKNARQNKYISAPPNMQLSAVNLVRQMDEGVSVIQVTGNMDPSAVVNVIDLEIDPNTYDKLSILRTRWWNECMNLLGIDGANQDKKERLVAAEVDANNGQTDSMRYVALNERQAAAEIINEIFDTNISVEFRVEVEAEAAQKSDMLGMNEKGGDGNGRVLHDEA